MFEVSFKKSLKFHQIKFNLLSSLKTQIHTDFEDEKNCKTVQFILVTRAASRLTNFEKKTNISTQEIVTLKSRVF